MHIAQRKDRWMDVCVFGKGLGFDGSVIWNPFFFVFPSLHETVLLFSCCFMIGRYSTAR